MNNSTGSIPMKFLTKDEMLAGAITNEGFTLDTKAAKEADFASGSLGNKQPVYQDAIMRGDTGKRSSIKPDQQ